MNDRTSAVPPTQFLGPEQLKSYENQFYSEPAAQHYARSRKQERPLSTPAQIQSSSAPVARTESESGQQHTVTHKKSTGFFGRVRDVLFNRGGGQQGPPLKQQEVRRKHSSLQEPLQHPPPARPEYLQAGRTQSEINITHILASPRGGSDRPSREDIMASYNELVSTGFFQSHAIQSTRHVAPGSARETPVLPVIQDSPRPPVRVSSIHAVTNSGSGSEPLVPSQSRMSREYGPAPSHPTLSYTPSAPNLHNKDSHYTLRSRKRGRGDADELTAPSPEPQSSSSAAYFAQPLKRVAKKLRKMPSLNFSTPTALSTADVTDAGYTARQSGHQTAADGIVRLAPSISSGGTLHPTERPVRLRSPSPAGPETVTPRYDEGRDERVYRRAGPVTATETRRPRRTFSYTLTESSRGRTRTSERDAHWSYKRDSSGTRSNSKPRVHNYGQTQTHNVLGPWQRVSLEDTIIHRDSSDSMRRDWQAEEQTAVSNNGGRSRTQQQQPLQVLPDANRGIPAVPKLPERWHGTGRAYHLKDRGSRPELVVRRSEDSGKQFEKENTTITAKANNRVDAHGDVDMLIVNHTSSRGRTRGREEHRQQQHYWHIGNAL